MDRVKDVIASAVRNALMPNGGGSIPKEGTGLVSWRHEITRITPLENQIKVWADGEGRPPRYFTVTVSEKQ